MKNRKALIILLLIFFLAYGFLRVYYGGGIGFKIVPKHSFSLKDTIVNLDDILGQPRIVVATQHPAVKRQLEEMGYIETDEQIQKRIKHEIEAEMKAEEEKIMKEYRKEIKKMEREFNIIDSFY